MAQYLMALINGGFGRGLGSRSPFFAHLGEGLGGEGGRMGDYVFTQDGLGAACQSYAKNLTKCDCYSAGSDSHPADGGGQFNTTRPSNRKDYGRLA